MPSILRDHVRSKLQCKLQMNSHDVQAMHMEASMVASGSLGDCITEPSMGPDTPDLKGYHDGSEQDGELAVDDSDFLNFSFKNLELLGERNKEMVEKMSALRAEMSDTDPYSHGWVQHQPSGTGTGTGSGSMASVSSSSTRR